MTTEYSIQKMVSDGTLSTIALGIQYLQRNDIYIRIAGEETPQSGAPSGYTWSFLDNTALKILPVVPNGVEVVVYRRTDVDAMYNIYSQNAQFDESTIDENNQQLLYIAQEYFEQGVPAQLIDSVEYVREDTTNIYYRLKLSGGKYTTEFPIPKGGAAGLEALRRTYADAGLLLVDGSFETGGTLSNATDVLLHNVTAKAYAWTGVFPHVVAPGTDPTAVGSGYVPHTDVLLRDELAGDGGAGLVGGLAKPVTWVGFAGGADPTGTINSDAAFQAAVDMTDGYNPNPTLYNTVPTPDVITIAVPSGKYKISSKVSPKGKLVIWLCDSGVEIDNHDNLCGKLIQNGVRNNARTSGILDAAAGFSVSVNRGLGKPAAVQGITSPSNLSSVTERDAVGFYADCGSVAPTLVVASATYTATKATPSVPVDVTDLVRGMIVDTDNGYAGVLDSWLNDGSELTVAGGWYQSGGSTTPATPPASGFKINKITKVWAHNANVVLVASADTTRAAGFELGLRNQKQNFTDPASTTDYMWGFDVVGFGPYPASVGYIQRPGVLRGYESSGATQEGFVVTERGGAYPTTALGTRCNSFEQIALRPNGSDSCFKVTNAGDVDIGAQAYAGTKTTRMRSSGLNNDYDTRIQSIGGTASPGQGVLRFGAAATEVQGNLRPVITNSSSCGTAAQAWANGFTQTAFTVLSDEDAKTAPLEITDAMLDAAAEVDWCMFQYLDRVEEKGADGARWHFGAISQRFVEAFARHGLDAHRFAFFCYDEWGDEFEQVQTNVGAFTTQMVTVSEPARTEIPAFLPDGTPLLNGDGQQIMLAGTVMTSVEVEVQIPDEPVFETIQTRVAGHLYGIRYEQAIILKQKQIERDHKRQLDALVARIEALENK